MAWYIQNIFWTAAFIVAGGLILIFSSTSFGIARADGWSIRMGGSDMETYRFVAANAANQFIVSGSVLLGMGLLLAMATYFYYLLKAEKEDSLNAEQPDAGGELGK